MTTEATSRTGLPLEDVSLMDERLLDRSSLDDGFPVRSKQDASQAFRAMKAAEAKKETLKAEMEKEIQAIENFYEPKIDRQDESIEYLETQITSFQESTGESISTPHGKAYSVSRTKWDWKADRDTLAAWAEQESPDLVTTEKKVSKNDIKSYVKDTWDERHEEDPPVVERRNVENTRVYTQ